MANTDLTDMHSEIEPFRYGGLYTVSQVALLADLPPSTVRRWVKGYEHWSAPRTAFGSATDGTPRLSFLHLIETVVVGRLRRGKQSVQLDRLQRAHAFAQGRFKMPFPFASLELRESGGQILHEFDIVDPHGPLLAVDIGGRWAIPGSVMQALDQMDFSATDRQAERWHPAGRSAHIVIDPRIGGGRPTVLGTGITVDTIHRRFLAGESIEFLADDYDLDATTIQEAIRFADRESLAVA
jgi:uncharacterized protein (DUF433 family)